MDAGKGNKESDVQKHGQEVGGGMIVAVKRGVPPTKPTRSSTRLRNQWLPFEVFDNELLRKKILGYAVFSGENKAENRNTACSLRLVGKTWNETVIKHLYKRQEPLIRLSCEDNESGRLLERFCNIFSTSIPINGCIPPFHLDIEYLEFQNVSALLNLITNCGEGLVQLNIGPAISWLSCNGQFPILSLPRLHKLEIFIMWHPNVDVGDVTSEQDGEDTVCSTFLNSVTRDATSIAEFKMTLDFFPSEVRRTSPLTDLPLPVTINNLQLFGYMRDEDVEVLTRNSLPNLTSLTLALNYDLLGNGSFFLILDNYRASLKRLSILDFAGPLNRPISFRFPIMEALEVFFFNSTILELGLVSLGKCFPKLRTLCLDDQTTSVFWKWTGNTKFIYVVSLQFSLGNLESLNMETMQGVNFAFPNLQNLELSFSGTETSGLKYMFGEMTQLTELKLEYCGNDPEVNSDFWDAVLTGIPLEIIAESRQDPGFWERFDMNEVDALGSILNLKELTSLSLFGYWQSNNMPPLISDVTFQRALLMMPNLKNLSLAGRFEASVEMAEEWTSEGRLLEYSSIID